MRHLRRARFIRADREERAAGEPGDERPQLGLVGDLGLGRAGRQPVAIRSVSSVLAARYHFSRLRPTSSPAVCSSDGLCQR